MQGAITCHLQSPVAAPQPSRAPAAAAVLVQLPWDPAARLCLLSPAQPLHSQHKFQHISSRLTPTDLHTDASSDTTNRPGLCSQWTAQLRAVTRSTGKTCDPGDMPTCGAGRDVRRVRGRPQVLRPVEHDAVLPQHCRAVAASLTERKLAGQLPCCSKLRASAYGQGSVRSHTRRLRQGAQTRFNTGVSSTACGRADAWHCHWTIKPACLLCIEHDHLTALQRERHVFVLTSVHLLYGQPVSVKNMRHVQQRQALTGNVPEASGVQLTRCGWVCCPV